MATVGAYVSSRRPLPMVNDHDPSMFAQAAQSRLSARVLRALRSLPTNKQSIHQAAFGVNNTYLSVCMALLVTYLRFVSISDGCRCNSRLVVMVPPGVIIQGMNQLQVEDTPESKIWNCDCRISELCDIFLDEQLARRSPLPGVAHRGSEIAPVEARPAQAGLNFSPTRRISLLHSLSTRGSNPSGGDGTTGAPNVRNVMFSGGRNTAIPERDAKGAQRKCVRVNEPNRPEP